MSQSLTIAKPLSLTKEEARTTELPPQKNFLYCLLRHPLCRPYFRLAAFIITINLIVLSKMVDTVMTASIVPMLLNIVLVNFTVAVFIRQQWVVNVLFKVATSVPKSWPLWIRWACGKVYHFGGIHIGSFFAGSLWYSLFTVNLVWNGSQSVQVPGFIVPIAIVHVLLLITMMIVALPQIRHPHHNLFEKVGRLGLWTSLLIFWVQTIAIFGYQDKNILLQPQTYVLFYITGMVAWPWMRLKKVPVHVVTPSNHVALANFDYGVTPFAGSSTDLSWNPLLEWHSFANIPSPDREGFRLTISRAGDWTGEFVDKKPTHIWVKGIPAAGVGNIELCFKKVVWVATGSGIGPCVPHLLDQKVPSKLIWSTRTPRKTYGDELVDEIMSAQPDALIWDTTANGKPDLVQLAYEAYRDSDAEAVIVISNQKTTFHINYQLESRGIPSFGAIWDS